MRKGQKHTPATLAKLRRAKLGNQNALGHSVSEASLANLEKNRGDRKVNPASLKNLKQFASRKRKGRAT